jgi:hypothetical protein
MAKFQLMAGAALQKRIDTFGKTMATTQQEAQDIGVQCLAHYAEHGDFTLLARFIGAKIGKRRKGERKFTITDDFPGVTGTFRKNIVAWIARFSDIRFNGEGMLYRMNRKSETFTAFHATIGNVLSKAGMAVDVDAAAAAPWWTLEGAQRDASRNAIDLLNLLAIADSIPKRIATALENDAEREEGDAHTYVPEQLDAMRAFAAAIEKAKDDFVKSQKINVVDLKAQREARKASNTVAPADVERAVTTGATPDADLGGERVAA